MKDLYTFDKSLEDALVTYELVKEVYRKLFGELKVPFLTATADSGNMGGDLSHEFHISCQKGEDTVVTCSSCDKVYNEEVASGFLPDSPTNAEVADTPGFEVEGEASKSPTVSTGVWMGVSRDRNTIVRAWYPKFLMAQGTDTPVPQKVNIHAIKAVAQAAGIELVGTSETPLDDWTRHIKLSKQSPDAKNRSSRPQVVDMYDSRVHVYERPPHQQLEITPEEADFIRIDSFPGTESKLSILKAAPGDRCPACNDGYLTPHTTVELGHTFHLGTRYSEPLGASVFNAESQRVPIEMGCHGIGVSRMMAAVADVLADSKGLNWPTAIAPYEVAVIVTESTSPDAETIYDLLADRQSEGASASVHGRNCKPVDALLDDRAISFGTKMKDADLIGYPVIVVIGKAWKETQKLEVQCRRLGVKTEVPVDGVSPYVRDLLARL